MSFSCSLDSLPPTIGHHGQHSAIPRFRIANHFPTRGNPDLVAVIRAEIDAAGGRIPFARFMELALYHPLWGYYLSPQRRPGRPGDFLTAPETHPFFGITLARQIAECWERLDRPDPLSSASTASGIGGLAWDVIAGLSRRRRPAAPRSSTGSSRRTRTGCTGAGGACRRWAWRRGAG